MKKTLPLIALVLVATCLVQVAVESPAAAATPVQIQVPPPVPELSVPMPQPPREAVRVPSLSPVDRAKMTAQVEVFRDGSNTPQRPLRRQQLLDWVYVTGDRPIVVRLQFDRSASGKIILIRNANNVSLQTSDAVLRVRPTGECVVALRLDPAATRGHITFNCQGFETTMPLTRASLADVAAKENASSGGGR